jgi:hypothetical protein
VSPNLQLSIVKSLKSMAAIAPPVIPMHYVKVSPVKVATEAPNMVTQPPTLDLALL